MTGIKIRHEKLFLNKNLYIILQYSDKMKIIEKLRNGKVVEIWENYLRF